MFKKMLAILILFAGLAYANSIEEIKKAINRGDNEAAFKLSLDACTKNNVAEGCFIAGESLRLTTNKENLPLVKVFFQRACDLGLQKGCDHVSKIHSTKKVPVKKIEAINLLRIFAIDESEEYYNAYSWQTGAEQSSPIQWEHSGLLDSENKSYVYERRGNVKLTNNGKITHKKLEVQTEEGTWSVKLLGARAGYFMVEIYPDVVTTPAPHIDIAKNNILKKIECNGNGAGEFGLMYLVKLKGKKPFWMLEYYSGGSAGGAFYYTITYDKKPTCLD